MNHFTALYFKKLFCFTLFGLWAFSAQAVYTKDEAQAAFDLLAHDPDLMNTVQEEGCYHRAVAGAWKLFKAGGSSRVKLIRIDAKRGETLAPVYSRWMPNGYVRWNHHYAILDRVRDEKTQKVEASVFELVRAKGPLPVKTWLSLFHGVASRSYEKLDFNKPTDSKKAEGSLALLKRNFAEEHARRLERDKRLKTLFSDVVDESKIDVMFCVALQFDHIGCSSGLDNEPVHPLGATVTIDALSEIEKLREESKRPVSAPTDKASGVVAALDACTTHGNERTALMCTLWQTYLASSIEQQRKLFAVSHRRFLAKFPPTSDLDATALEVDFNAMYYMAKNGLVNEDDFIRITDRLALRVALKEGGIPDPLNEDRFQILVGATPKRELAEKILLRVVQTHGFHGYQIVKNYVARFGHKAQPAFAALMYAYEQLKMSRPEIIVTFELLGTRNIILWEKLLKELSDGAYGSQALLTLLRLTIQNAPVGPLEIHYWKKTLLAAQKRLLSKPSTRKSDVFKDALFKSFAAYRCDESHQLYKTMRELALDINNWPNDATIFGKLDNLSAAFGW